jgi:hypothetical protein
MMLSAHFSAFDSKALLLRLDSGSNVPVLYAADPHLRRAMSNRASVLTRAVNGVDQSFAVLPPQDLLLGRAHPLKQVPFVMPMNAVGKGPAPREDGLLPTIAFERVFVSPSAGYAVLQLWEH